MESEEKYRVVKSRSRVYNSANSLKGLYTFNAALIGLSFLLSTIPTILLLLNFVKQSSGSILQSMAGLGLTFFFSLTLANLVALLINIGIIYLLALGVRKDWPLLTGAISIMTATVSLMILAFMIFSLLLIATDNRSFEAIAALNSFILNLVSVNTGVAILVIFVNTLIAIYYLAFLLNGTGGFREAMVETPLSTLFPNGVLVESARKSDVSRMIEIYFASQRYINPDKHSHELWKQLMKGVKLERDVRVARVDADVAGFLITSQSFRKVESVHLASTAIADHAEESLLRDFARLYTRSNQYVDFVEVSSNDSKLQKALSQNGWKKSSSKPLLMKVGYRYGDGADESSNDLKSA